MQRIPRGRFVSVQPGLRRDLRADEIQCIGLSAENARQRLALGATLADDDNHLALAALVLPLAAVFAILAAIRRLHIAAKITAIDLGPLAVAADRGLAN